MACVEILRACLAKSATDRVASAQSLAWMARGALRVIEGGRPEPRHTSSEQPASGRGGVLARLGLARAPFSNSAEARGLEQYEPFGSTGSELRASLRTTGGSVLLLGEPGSGRSSLLREILTPSFWPGARAWIDVDSAATKVSLELRACRAFGAVPSSLVSNNGAIEGLLDHLADSSTQTGGPALLVVKARGVLRAYARELEALSRAASATGYFTLIVVGSFDAAHALPDPAVVTLPPYSRLQLLDYLRGRLERCRAPGAAPLLVTPDAALLLHAQSGGNLRKVNQLATRVLTLVAARGSRVLTSSHARAAAEAVDGASGFGSEAHPTAELLTILNGERLATGLLPRERHLPSAYEREPKI